MSEKVERFLWEILVPTVMGEKPVRTRFHRVWDVKVREIAKGMTILTPAKGQWISPDGELFMERMIPVRIACTAEEIEQISDMTAKHYQQKSIMYYKISDDVVIKNYEAGKLILADKHEIDRLKEENASLKALVASLRKQIEDQQKYTSNRRRYDDDYLPYEDDDRY